MTSIVTIEQKVLGRNADVAAQNRRELDERGWLALGLLSAPGSGKTSLLECTLAALAGRVGVAVIEGDVQTDRDARRIAVLDVPVVQIVTNGTCHLEARMVQEALTRLPREGVDVLFVENVGNLVCPASYDLGEHLRVVLLSVAEGEDKPVKYPALFRKADVVIINKVDLLPHVDYDIAQARAFVHQVSPDARIFEVSCRTGAGLSDWVGYLEERVAARRPRGGR